MTASAAVMKFCLQWCSCCGCVEQEVEVEQDQAGATRYRQNQEMIEQRQQQFELSKRHRQMGLSNYSANETAARFSKKLETSRSPTKRAAKAVKGAVDDINSIVFNVITDDR